MCVDLSRGDEDGLLLDFFSNLRVSLYPRENNHVVTVSKLFVIPTKVGISINSQKIPAFAGMTKTSILLILNAKSLLFLSC